MRLGLLLTVAMISTLAVLGYFNIKHHRAHLEQATLLNAERVSDLIERSANYCMLRNDREGLYHIIDTIAGQPGVVGIRIYDHTGQIALSTNPDEEGELIGSTRDSGQDSADATQQAPDILESDSAHIFHSKDGSRTMKIINPIENQPACWEAACHAHPESQMVLGIMDTRISLARADADLAEGNSSLLQATLIAVAVASLMSGLFVWRMVHRPVQALHAGTRRLGAGELGYQITIHAPAELGELASSFNSMSAQLHEAREEITAWNQSLEERVEQKSREVKRAHERIVHVEKMASIGKLAATVAHEINNPLSGILTYAKLLGRRAQRDLPAGSTRDAFLDPLLTIELESRRCGEIVRNLLQFARTSPMNLDWENANAIINRTLKLVAHQIELEGIQLHTQLDRNLPSIRCDAGQIEQALLAIVMNAIEALTGGGNIWISSSYSPQTSEVSIEIKDDGLGIPPEIHSALFEPFVTTKDSGMGIGLGLAVCKEIVEHHGGTIELTSRPDTPTSFTFRLPVSAAESMAELKFEVHEMGRNAS
jgi:two-component system NtrC family sensor kinase